MKRRRLGDFSGAAAVHVRAVSHIARMRQSDTVSRRFA